MFIFEQESITCTSRTRTPIASILLPPLFLDQGQLHYPSCAGYTVRLVLGPYRMSFLQYYRFTDLAHQIPIWGVVLLRLLLPTFPGRCNVGWVSEPTF